MPRRRREVCLPNKKFPKPFFQQERFSPLGWAKYNAAAVVATPGDAAPTAAAVPARAVDAGRPTVVPAAAAAGGDAAAPAAEMAPPLYAGTRWRAPVEAPASPAVYPAVPEGYITL